MLRKPLHSACYARDRTTIGVGSIAAYGRLCCKVVFADGQNSAGRRRPKPTQGEHLAKGCFRPQTDIASQRYGTLSPLSHSRPISQVLRFRHRTRLSSVTHATAGVHCRTLHCDCFAPCAARAADDAKDASNWLFDSRDQCFYLDSNRCVPASSARTWMGRGREHQHRVSRCKGSTRSSSRPRWRACRSECRCDRNIVHAGYPSRSRSNQYYSDCRCCRR